MDFLKDKSLLITGGTGSFGRALTRRLLTETQIKKVIILSRDEWKQSEMRQSDPLFDHPNIRYFLGDVRDPSRLKRAFNEVDFIVHAAALKQVPAAEYNPTEFIKTNILGATNVIEAAIDCGVQKVIALSSDKSVNPVNLYGATKLCSDRLFVAGNSYVGAIGNPKFSVVRYGNVLGSRGSVIPYWKKLMANGAQTIPITDETMTRFWMTLEQSVEFVLKCFDRTKGGEVFIPKIPSMKITDLATAVAPHLPQQHVGIRPGEKINELMISSDDAYHTREYEDHYLIIPETLLNNPTALENFMKDRPGKILPDHFSYASHTNTEWLTVEGLQKLLPLIDKHSF